ncbi:hypothetical protein [Herbaspirillum sp. C7C8]|uniref:hypothetical protein n=1 Tax=Herbaspirillum sp. C7C8 TaxID=2736665 RepID=UPI001F5235E3|nr:hypothetical protein [Herbaspirillum sp. C7C8]MCI1005226.1 hypothetical protein [Herbaspirillum sp. C7C8]
MTRPAFQFYPADWRNNAKLRRCSWAARGAWADVMCLLHDSDEYGILRWPLKEIAQAIGCPVTLLKELVEKKVLKGTDKGECAALEYTPRSGRQAGPTVTLIPITQGPIWFSSRMVRDEYIRQKKANRELYKDSPNYSPMPPIGDEENTSPMPPLGELSGAAPMPPKSDLPSSSSSSSVKTKNLKPLSGDPDEMPPGFAEFWKTWPRSERKVAKAECLKRWKAKVLEPHAAVIVNAVKAQMMTKKWQDGYEPSPLVFLNQSRWLDDVADMAAAGDGTGPGQLASQGDQRFRGAK